MTDETAGGAAATRELWDSGASRVDCSIARTLDLVGEKWTLLVLRDVFTGVRRFDDLRRTVGAPRQVLAGRLARLVDAGILRRQPYREPGQRSRDEYRLTRAGMELYPVLVALMGWGDRHLASPDGPPTELTHRDCGAAVEVTLRCTDGHGLDSAREITARPGPGARAPVRSA